MPKLTRHPGVSIVACGRSPYHLSFTHPLLNKQIKRSCKQRDYLAAEALAIELHTILQNPDEWKRVLPETVSPVLRALWSGDIVQEAAEEAVAYLRNRPLSVESGDKILLSNGSLLNAPAALAQADENVAKLLNETMEANQKLNETVAVQAARIEILEKRLRAFDAEAASNVSSLTVAESIKVWLKDGCGAKERKKASYLSWLNGFSNSLPATTQVMEVSSKMVIDYIAGRLAKKDASKETLKAICVCIVAFLNNQTSGAFRSAPVLEFKKSKLKSEKALEQVAPYWLDQEDVDALLKHLPDEWRDVAALQWEMAARPEELPFLRSEHVTFDKDIRVEVTSWIINGEIFWEPKTAQSYGKVHCREESRKLLKRLLTRGEITLFPNNGKNAGAFKTWKVDSWTDKYLAALRDAAQKAGLNVERFDGRTLRRSAGRRVLIESNYNIGQTAAFVRDLESTVIAHYAKLLPDDVRQPERQKKAAKKKK